MFSVDRLKLMMPLFIIVNLVGISFIYGLNKKENIDSHSSINIVENIPGMNFPEEKSLNNTEDEDEVSEEIYLPYVQVFFDPLIKSVLTAQVSAPIVSINKRMGSSFQPGETLIQLFDNVYVASVGKAKGLLKKAEIGLNAKKALYEDGVASLFDVADYEAAVASAKSDLAAAEYLYDCCTLDVPYPGYVAAVLVNDFETPQIGQPLIEVVDIRVLLAKMLFDSTYIEKVYVGQKVKIDVKEIGEVVEGTVVRIAPIVDPASAKFKVEAEVKNPRGKIKPGMSGKITLKTLTVSPSEIPQGGALR